MLDLQGDPRKSARDPFPAALKKHGPFGRIGFYLDGLGCRNATNPWIFVRISVCKGGDSRGRRPRKAIAFLKPGHRPTVAYPAAELKVLFAHLAAPRVRFQVIAFGSTGTSLAPAPVRLLLG